MNRPPFPHSLLAALLPLALAGQALAADSALPTVTVTARTPTQDQTIGRAQLQKTQARDLQDIYHGDSEISVGGGGNPIAQKVYIRGLEEAMLNLSIDGAQHNGNVYHHQSSLIIDPQLLKSVEVEKGTAAASAGPGALGGAIRLQTVDGRDFLTAGESVGGSVGAGINSNAGWRSQATLAARGEQVDGLLSLSRLENRNYRGGNGEKVPHSATEQNHLLAKLGIELAPGHRLSASHQYSKDEGVRTARANMLSFNHPILPNDPIPQSLSRHTSVLKYEGSRLGMVDKAELNLYRSQNDSERTNLAGRNWGEQIDTVGADLNLKSSVGEHLLKYGFNWRQEESQARNILNKTGNTGSGKEDGRVAGGYVEGVLNFAPLTIAAGLRYDDYQYRDNHGQTFRSDGASPSLNASWQLDEHWQLKAGHARALRGVWLKEAFMLDIATWKNGAQVNPEKARNTELGFVFRNGGFSLSGNAYRQIITDYVTTTGKCNCRGNAGTARVDGFELASEYRHGALSSSLSLSHSKPELDGVDLVDEQGLGASSGLTMASKLGYQLSSRVELGWQARLVEGYDYIPVGGNSANQRRSGYGLHDVYVSWLPLSKDSLRVNFTVKNLFDKQYYDQATFGYHNGQKRVLGYTQPGRDLRVDLNWRF